MKSVQDQGSTIQCCKSYLMCLKTYHFHYVPHTVLSVIVKNKNIYGLWYPLFNMAQIMVQCTYCTSMTDHGC